MRSSWASESGPAATATVPSPEGGCWPSVLTALERAGSNRYTDSSWPQQANGVRGDEEVFVRPQDADGDGPAVPGDDRRLPVVALRVEPDTEELQAGADAFADRRRMFADPAGE